MNEVAAQFGAWSEAKRSAYRPNRGSNMEKQQKLFRRAPIFHFEQCRAAEPAVLQRSQSGGHYNGRSPCQIVHWTCLTRFIIMEFNVLDVFHYNGTTRCGVRWALPRQRNGSTMWCCSVRPSVMRRDETRTLPA